MKQPLDAELLITAAQRRPRLDNFDPIEVVRSLYSWLGRDLLGDVELRMRTFLSAHPNGKHGNHSYTLAAFGLDSAKLRERFSSYRTCINLTFKS